jgi:fructose-1,6-bisphosphatase I
MAEIVTVEEHVSGEAGAELAGVVGAVAEAARQIERRIRVAALHNAYGAYGATNVQGEQQQKLDVFANDVMKAALMELPQVAAIVSEEDDAPVVFDRASGGEPTYVAVFDPLDGSSNIDVNVNVGTIFGVHQVGTKGVEETFLRRGLRQVAAGYVVYGPSTVMVVTTGTGVSSFTLNEDGVFARSAVSMVMPDQGPYYSTNEANAGSWPGVYREFLKRLVSDGLDGQMYSARYIGSLVADFHRTLLKGGVFLYPPTHKAPKGKLRLLYEANPLAMIAEQAGGAAVNGPERILGLTPEHIHQRTALIIGSRCEVEALQTAVLEWRD